MIGWRQAATGVLAEPRNSLHPPPWYWAMSTPDRQSHWQNVYQSKGEQQVSWTQPNPEPSLGLIEKFASGKQASIIDIGGGASRLVDALRERGFEDLTVLDLSDAALQKAKDRLGAPGA